MGSFDFQTGTLPLLVSIPHAGTLLTPEVEQGLSEAARAQPDTDWHIPQLYDFARAMGASLLVGRYSRMVVDLNRPADDTPLYTSATTGLFTDTLFDGTPTFIPGNAPTPEQRNGYLQHIWQPYHQQIQQELARLKARYGYALVFDAHSIASRIPRLFDGQLPDLNIGTHDGASCSSLVGKAIRTCCADQTAYRWVINGRFKGGYITRAYGQPAQYQHAVQLELAQCNYMDEQFPFVWQEEKASVLQAQLRRIIDSYLACF